MSSAVAEDEDESDTVNSPKHDSDNEERVIHSERRSRSGSTFKWTTADGRAEDDGSGSGGGMGGGGGGGGGGGMQRFSSLHSPPQHVNSTSSDDAPGLPANGIPPLALAGPTISSPSNAHVSSILDHDIKQRRSASLIQKQPNSNNNIRNNRNKKRKTSTFTSIQDVTDDNEKSNNRNDDDGGDSDDDSSSSDDGRDQKSKNPFQKPRKRAKRSATQSTSSPVSKSGKSSDKPGGKSSDKPGCKSSDKPGGKSGDKSGGKSGGKSAKSNQPDSSSEKEDSEEEDDKEDDDDEVSVARKPDKPKKKKKQSSAKSSKPSSKSKSKSKSKSPLLSSASASALSSAAGGAGRQPRPPLIPSHHVPLDAVPAPPSAAGTKEWTWKEVSGIPLAEMTPEQFHWYYRHCKEMEDRALLLSSDDRDCDVNETYGGRIDRLVDIKADNFATSDDLVEVIQRWESCLVPGEDTVDYYALLSTEIFALCQTESERFERWRSITEALFELLSAAQTLNTVNMDTAKGPKDPRIVKDLIEGFQQSMDRMLVTIVVNQSTSQMDVRHLESMLKRMDRRKIRFMRGNKLNKWKTNAEDEEEDKKQDEFLILLHRMLDYAQQHHCIRIGNSRIQRAIFTKDGKYTKAYRDCGETGDIAEFVEEAVYDDEEFWNALNKKPKNAEYLVKRLQHTKDNRLPQAIRMRAWHSFLDGMWMADKRKFLTYDSIAFRRLPKNRIASAYHHCYFNDEASEYIVREMGNLVLHKVWKNGDTKTVYEMNDVVDMKWTRWKATYEYKMHDHVDHLGRMWICRKSYDPSSVLNPSTIKNSSTIAFNSAKRKEFEPPGASEDGSNIPYFTAKGVPTVIKGNEYWSPVSGTSYLSIKSGHQGQFPPDSPDFWKPIPYHDILNIPEPIQDICKLQEWKVDERIHVYAEGGALFHAKRKTDLFSKPFDSTSDKELLHPFQQHLPVHLGPGGCGKTTLLKIYSLFFDAQDIAQFKTHDEDVFGMERLPEAFIWMGYDIGRNWKIDPHFLFTLIDGGWIKLNRKFKTSILYFVEQFGMIAMNEYLAMADPAGALSRRLLLHFWEFLPVISNSNLVREAEQWVGYIMKKCCYLLYYLTYHVYRGQLAKEDHPCFPQSMRTNIREMKQSVNPMLAFFESDKVVMDSQEAKGTKGYYVDINTLMERFHDWCKRAGLSSKKKLNKTMKDILKLKNLKLLYQRRPDYIGAAKKRYRDQMEQAKRANNGGGGVGGGVGGSVGGGNVTNASIIAKPVVVGGPVVPVAVSSVAASSTNSLPPQPNQSIAAPFEYNEKTWVVGCTLTGLYQEECLRAMAQFQQDQKEVREREEKEAEIAEATQAALQADVDVGIDNGIAAGTAGTTHSDTSTLPTLPILSSAPSRKRKDVTVDDEDESSSSPARKRAKTTTAPAVDSGANTATMP